MRHSLPEPLLQKADALRRLADEREFSLAAAESYIGGLLSSLLTDLEGLSHVFERGFVVYSKASRQRTDAPRETFRSDRTRRWT